MIDLLAPGGVLVTDDLTPGRAIKGDPIRAILLRDERLAGVEIVTSHEASAILAVRRS